MKTNYYPTFDLTKIKEFITDEGIELMGKNITVVTHNGNFHTDEILAIAILSQFASSVDVTRSRDKKDFENKDFVLDVSRKFDPSKGIFDHHQDPELPATNMLITRHLFKGTFLTLLEVFMKEISDIDRGLKSKDDKSQLNEIVNSFKGMDDAWDIALSFVTTALVGQMYKCHTMLTREELWESMVTVGVVKYSKDPMPVIVDWKDLALRDGIMFEVIKCTGDEGTIINSADNDKCPVLKHDNQIHIADNGFFARYHDFETALAHALNMSMEYKKK